ncbi:TonB-dependent receptor plug domain-containing protein [Rhodanobacter lindaniclasticus]|uniref:TonB-dependent receptor n=1 Tax=Rhodanobacter lindaniclasticus TaxID=75310 RepID=A0A4S3KMY9_9GAMM|nr:TonB-dependent receptor [Rhodanobacter lindaniclasticus]THD10293.1 TonB-dependent receptor [Rhodanobacter lindaniclasticus]
MKLLNKKLATAVRYALSVGALVATGAVFAQDTTPTDQTQPTSTKTLQTVVVTGSRIRSADIETAQPIIVMDRTQIENQGFNSVADILQNLPQAGTPPISRSSVLASGEDVGGYYIDMRNLGANRTLILLNGKRLGTTTSGLQDLSQIPMSAIDRIEVLKDGASAIYGSDAIAGVVNIITRKNFDGAEASAYLGQYSQGDGDKQTYSMTMGAHSDKGSITFSAEYSKEDPVWAKDRDFSRFGSTTRHPTAGWSIVSQYGNFFMPDGYCASGLCALNPGGNPANPADWHDTGAGGGTNDRSNPNTEMMLNTGIERHSLFVSGDYNITDNIKFSSDFLYNKRSTLQQVAGYPFQPAFYMPFTLPNDRDPIGLEPSSYFNPTGEKVYFYRRGWEVPRTTQSDLTTYRFSGTLEGSFDIGEHTWNWDIGGFVNDNSLLKVQHGDFSLIGAQGALGPSFLDPSTGLVTCGTGPDNALPYGSAPGSCVPWNPFIPSTQGGPNSLSDPTLQAYLFPYYHDTGHTRTVDYSANITGSVFTLPAGDLSVAAGFEYRHESGDFVPDAFSQAGISTNLSSGPTGGGYNTKEYYVELEAPLLKDLPFAQSLTANVASRYSDYSSFGTTTNNKFSLAWKPIDDLLVRGTYAEGFRAPTIGDLFGGISGTFDYYTDPCDTVRGAAATNPAVAARCSSGFGGQPGTPANFQQLGQGGVVCANLPCQTGIQNFAGANPNLQPETSISRTLGAVYSPSWIQGLDLSLDMYRIRINNAITGDSMSAQLSDCYVLGAASRCASGLFQRDPATGVVTYELRGGRNAGWVDTKGYDFGVNYRLPEFSFGKFAVHWNSTYTDYYNVKADNEPTTVVSPSTSFGGNFRVRSNLGVDWTLGDFSASWMTRYYSSMKETCSFDNVPGGGPECNMPDYIAPDTGPVRLRRTGANTFHDVQFRWNAPWNATISVGANNVFGHVGPIMYSAPNSQYSYYGGFDIGRFYYLRYNQKF